MRRAGLSGVLLLVGCTATEDDPAARPGTPDIAPVSIDALTYNQGKEDATPTAYGDEWKENEQPQHPVTLSAFAIDPTEVTVEAWAGFLDGIGNAAAVFHHALQPVEWNGEQWLAREGESTLPIRYVSWFDAAAYCAWAGGRLPTEAEWELAAKGPDGDDRYPWGAGGADCDLAVYFTNRTLCETRPQPVGSRSPQGDSFYGLSDMAGNVAEWVHDRYGRYTAGEQTDPIGEPDGDYRVMRGGGFRDTDDSIRTTARWAVQPDRRSEGVGFRCAHDVQSDQAR